MTGPAAAAGLEASLNGYMEQWFGFSSQDEDDTNGPAAGGSDFTTTNFVSDTEVHFNAVATLDNGIKVQYHVELEGNTSGDQIDESYLQITANWGQIVFGSENSAHYKMGYAPDQYGVTTISGDATNWINASGQGGGTGRWRTPFGSAWQEVGPWCNDDKRLTFFTPRFSGFQFGASYAANCGTQDTNGLGNDAGIEHVFDVGANFKRKFDQISVALSTGYSHGERPSGNTGDDPEVITVGGKLGFADFTLGGYWGTSLGAVESQPAFDGLGVGVRDYDNSGFAIGGAYATGPWGVSLVWMHGRRDGEQTDGDSDVTDIIELGAQYKLGPGVALRGSVYYADFDSERATAGEWDNNGFAIVGGMKVSF
jgi:predicted porin